jgi:hypothetical protein
MPRASGRTPSRSLVADVPPPLVGSPHEAAAVSRTHMLVLLTAVAGLALLVWGLTARGWYLVEMSALFLALALAIALVARIPADAAARTFGEGAAELTMTALLVGFARAIQVVLDDGGVIDTIVHGLSVPLQALGPSLAAVGMFAVQSAINLFIPSGSGQAYVTMPIMAPLADLVGVSRQVAVIAFQFGDGFTNILVPTNPVIIGILSVAGVPYERWLRFVVPFMLKVWLVGSLALVAAVWMGGVGRVTGTVLDDSGGVLPGATVTLTNVGTNQVQVAVTNEVGAFTFPQVPVGTYTINVSLEGFRAVDFTNMIVAVGQEYSLTAKLEIGHLGNRHGHGGLLDRLDDDAGGEQHGHAEQVLNIPLANRDVTNLIKLQAGVPGMNERARTPPSTAAVRAGRRSRSTGSTSRTTSSAPTRWTSCRTGRRPTTWRSSRSRRRYPAPTAPAARRPCAW